MYILSLREVWSFHWYCALTLTFSLLLRSNLLPVFETTVFLNLPILVFLKYHWCIKRGGEVASPLGWKILHKKVIFGHLGATTLYQMIANFSHKRLHLFQILLDQPMYIVSVFASKCRRIWHPRSDRLPKWHIGAAHLQHQDTGGQILLLCSRSRGRFACGAGGTYDSHGVRYNVPHWSGTLVWHVFSCVATVGEVCQWGRRDLWFTLGKV